MEIKLNSQIDSVAWAKKTHPNASREIERESDISAFETSKALESQLSTLPDVREDKLERALELVGDPAYPPRETMKGLAALLAVHLKSDIFQE